MSDTVSTMSVSVIMPTYNRRDALLQTLVALARTDYPAHLWEAVVVDDGSTDNTEAAVREWVGKTEAPVRHIMQKNAGPAAARNRGAAEARGEVLIFIDNDIIVEPDFIQQHVKTLAAHPGSWIVGRVTHPPELRQTPFGRYRDDLWESYHRAQGVDGIRETNGITAANLSLPAANFRRLKGFDEGFTIASSEDWELGTRARKEGIRILYNPEIVVLHNDWAIALDPFCERQRLYSVSDVLLGEKYRELSPRASLVCENAPVDWGRDKLKLIAKKGVKRALATRSGRRIVRGSCGLAERFAPDSRLTHRAYDLAVAVATFRGVREGIERYGGGFARGERGCAGLEKA